MVKQTFAVFGAAVGLTVSSLAFAGEHAVKRSDVPDAVIKAVTGRYPQGEMKRFIREVEHGKTAYEVLLDLGGSRTELIVAADGRIQVEERVITLADLPDAVQKGLGASRFGKAKVLRVERVTKANKVDAPTYEIIVSLDGKKHEVAFSNAGKLLTAEEADEED
jgi:hypothetical protein